MADFENLKVSNEDSVRILSLNRVAKKNAFSIELAQELTAALNAAAEDDGVRVVVVTAEGDFFSAGVDLNLFASMGAGGDVSHVTNIHQPLRKVAKPLIAAVNGPAIGMGVTLLPFFDLVYAADTATFKTPFVQLGIVLEFGSSYTLPRIIGRQRTNELILRAKPIDAQTALDWGLVTRVFPKAALMDEVLQIAKDLAGNGPNAVRKSKDLILRGEIANTVDDAIKAEWEVLAGCYGSEENVQASMAFFNRKK